MMNTTMNSNGHGNTALIEKQERKVGNMMSSEDCHVGQMGPEQPGKTSRIDANIKQGDPSFLEGGEADAAGGDYDYYGDNYQ